MLQNFLQKKVLEFGHWRKSVQGSQVVK